MATDKPRRLGRGLEALITSHGPAPPAGDRSSLSRLPIGEIRPNPFQPRQEFRPEELAELEASMRATGLLQPITVRPHPGGSGYELIAGERRLRAASRLGWTDIPATVREIDDRTLLTLALVENLQRADLNPIEEAQGYQRLASEFSLTQQQIADAVGKDRATIGNILRLLNLPASVRRMLQEGHLTLGHARALLAMTSDDEMVALAREILAKGLTVRDVERRIRNEAPARRRERASRKADSSTTSQATAHAKHVAAQLRRRLQTDVSVALTSAERGSIEIVFYSVDDLERLLEIILGSDREPT